jgi:hypothetical protein
MQLMGARPADISTSTVAALPFLVNNRRCTLFQTASTTGCKCLGVGGLQQQIPSNRHPEKGQPQRPGVVAGRRRAGPPARQRRVGNAGAGRRAAFAAAVKSCASSKLPGARGHPPSPKSGNVKRCRPESRSRSKRSLSQVVAARGGEAAGTARASPKPGRQVSAAAPGPRPGPRLCG